MRELEDLYAGILDQDDTEKVRTVEESSFLSEIKWFFVSTQDK